VASRADLPSRREIALAIPFLPFLGLEGPLPGPSRGEDEAARGGYSTAILLRHAEKDAASDPKDPALSVAGQERARALLRLLARAGATHLFASEYRRTRETLGPLAQARSLEIQAVPAADVPGLASRIRGLPAGSVAVVAGHSNTVPSIASALGGAMKDLVSSPSGPALRDDEYARLLILAWPVPAEAKALPTSLIELAYGA